jgi:aspartate aminotransferase
MSTISSRARAVEPSRTIAFNQRARELKAAGRDIIDLTVGEPDFHPPRPVLEAAAAALVANPTGMPAGAGAISAGATTAGAATTGATTAGAATTGATTAGVAKPLAASADRYTPVPGLPELRSAAADWLSQGKGFPLKADDLLVTCGAKSGIATAMLALLDPGDEVLIPLPAWPTYAEMAKLAGGVPIGIPTAAQDGFRLDPERLRVAISPRTRMLVLCSPANPTGAVYNLAQLEDLASVLAGRPDIWVLSDEVYNTIRYVPDVPSPGIIPSLRERLVLIDGLSKSHAMTGWRIGFLWAPPTLAKACIAIQGQTITCAPAISQIAAITALRTDQSVLDTMVAAYANRRAFFCALLQQSPGLDVRLPEAAFYAYPGVTRLFGSVWQGKPIDSSDAVALYLLETAGVAVVPGSAFGDDGSMRISFAAADSLLEAAGQRIVEALGQLA